MNRSIMRKRPGGRNQNQNSQRPRPRTRRGNRRNRGGVVELMSITSATSNSALGQNAQRGMQATKMMGVIEREELITLVNGSVAFTATKFPVQPGNANTFPVGSPEAKNWTEWSAKLIEVQFVPTVSEFATQGQIGEVAIGVDYNAANDAPTAMNQIEAMHFAGGGIPSRGFSLKLLPQFINKSDPKYVRPGALPAGDDIRLYDGGNIWFATAGCTNGGQIGKLLIRYHFDVRLPTLLNPDAGTPIARTTSLFSLHNAQVIPTSALFPIHYDTTVTDALGIGAPASGVFSPPPGAYAIAIQTSALDTSVEAFTLQAFLYHNGAPTAPQMNAFTQLGVPSGASMVPQAISQSLLGVVDVASGDTVEVRVVLSGAAGTLSLFADGCQIMFTVA